ncbi:hypothetical protein PWY87_16250 [Kribbella solani]|uniref:hypothetical protein n=1 Tax=Kribbella solani TaxID=236067 RepID=UPI0029A5475C|nr:hypothetical protein [Kribbella solani]MDX3003243.1 hypothetical protein [Kribbella solani]
MTVTHTVGRELDTGRGRDLPVAHDFPYPICFACGFPIPAIDLGGTEFEPCHASACQPTRPRTGYQEVS